MDMLQNSQIEPVIHNSNLLLEYVKQGPIILTRQSEPVAVIARHDVWMKLVAHITLSELGRDLQLLPTGHMSLNENNDLDKRIDKIEKDEEPKSSLFAPPAEQISDRDRMLAALKSAPPMSDENAQAMDRLIQEAREASIDYALLT